MGNGVTANQLRQRVGRYLGLIIYITSDPTDITSSQIGEMISKVKDFLVLEAVLMLFGYLTPPLKKGRESRTTFIKEVFNLSTFPAHDRIVSLADSSAPDKWDSTLTKIVAILAESDLSSPQPFDVKKINVSNTLMTLEPPFYVDKKGFSGNYELADGNIDLLEIPFVALKTVRCNVERSNAAISLELSRSIDVGGRRVEIESTSDAKAALSFVVPVTRLSHFMQALKHRHVVSK
ncbi:hypothetical protein BJ165DRAFT_604554 [Panaeolus papilionaceus]|nr:hypothetical protein BJ165DRAFT_604554 [Panaeolus papilionaceus]